MTRREGCGRTTALASILTIVAMLLCSGCGQGDLRGTYDVELEIAGLRAPLTGSLILSTASLDIPSSYGTTTDREWLGGDPIDANSCLILHARSTSSDAAPVAQSVHIFALRMGARDAEVPIEIPLSSIHLIEITKLQFFANAIGGDLVLRDQESERPGRIHGVRTGPPSGQQCLDDLAAFQSRLEERDR